MNVVVSQYVRGLLDVRNDIEGIRAVASSKTFSNSDLRAELQGRLSAISVPEQEEGLGYLGQTRLGLLFCRFEPYSGAGGKYTQVRAMLVSGLDRASFDLRELIQKLPARAFYTDVRSLDEIAFDLLAEPPRWGSGTLRDDGAERVRDLLTNLLAGRRLPVDTNTAAAAEVEGRLHDAWSLLPPSLRNGVTFTWCREASNRPESPQIQFVQGRPHAGSGEMLWFRFSDTPEAASSIAESLTELARGAAPMKKIHRDADNAVAAMAPETPRAEQLKVVAEIVQEWRAWWSLQQSGFGAEELDAYLTAPGVKTTRWRRVANAIVAGDDNDVRTIVTGLPADAMYPIGQEIAKHSQFSDDAVRKIDRAAEELPHNVEPLWRSMVIQSAASGGGAKVLSIERVWRLSKTNLPISAEQLFSKFSHDCGEAVDDHGWWRLISPHTVSFLPGSHRVHAPKCPRPLKWAYFLALPELQPNEHESLKRDAEKEPDEVADFLEEWLRAFPDADLSKRTSLFLAALKKQSRDHGYLATRLAPLPLKKEDQLAVKKVLERSKDPSALAPVQLRESLDQIVQALRSLSFDVQKTPTAAGRSLPRDVVLLSVMTLIATSNPEVNNSALLDTLVSLLRGPLEPVGSAMADRLAPRMQLASAEQALAWAWLAEWLTQRPGSAAKILAETTEQERKRIVELCVGIVDELGKTLEAPSNGKGKRRIFGWLGGD